MLINDALHHFITGVSYDVRRSGKRAYEIVDQYFMDAKCFTGQSTTRLDRSALHSPDIIAYVARV